MQVVLFHLVLRAYLNPLGFHFFSCYMVYYSHIFNAYYCFTPFFFLFQMPWLWRKHARPYLYRYPSSQRNTETHCDGCYNSLVACSKCTVYELYIVCFVKTSFAGCEEEGCLLCCCCCCPLVGSPAKGWPRGASRGTPMARTGDWEGRGTNIGLEGNSGWTGPGGRSDHVAQGFIHLGLCSKASEMTERRKIVLEPPHSPNLLRCYSNSGSHGKLLN